MAAPANPAARPWLDQALLAAMVLLFGVSGGMLWHAGYNYEGLTGSVATKIHPYTYVIVAVFFIEAAKSGNPFGYLAEAARLRPASILLLAATVLMFIHILIRSGPGLAGAIDTYVGPPLLLILLGRSDERGLRRLETALHVVMTVNALMAIAEFGSKTLVFPYRFDGATFPTDHRSSALHGHPLVNASVTGFYMLALLNGGRVLPRDWKWPLFALQFAALVTFGGRSAMVEVMILGGCYSLVGLHVVLRRGRVSLLAAALALFLLICLPTAIAALALGGFFDALLERFVSDGGSANARVQMFELFNQLPFRDILVGPDAALVDSLRRIEGLEWGIENPIIRTLLYQGVIVTLMMTVAVTLFHVELAFCAGRGVWLPMLFFVIVLQTSESIGGKTTMLSKFALVLVCMYRPQAARRQPAGIARPSASTMAGSNARVASSRIPKPSNRFQ